MYGLLNEQDLKKNPSTESVPVLDGGDGNAERYLDSVRVCEFAEAADPIRLVQLLHRTEYEPVVAVRDRTSNSALIRVYFRQLHETILPLNDDCESNLERSSWPLPAVQEHLKPQTLHHQADRPPGNPALLD